MRGTRIVFAASIIAFLGIAAITILETAGYQVEWKPFRLRHVAGLTVTSSAKASVYLDETLLGATPIHRSALPPGTFHLRIHRDGYVDWEATVQLVGGKAKIIGPITLLPTLPKSSEISIAKNDRVLPDPMSGIQFLAHQEDEAIWSIRDLTHQTQASIRMSEAPLSLTSNDEGSAYYLQGKQGGIVYAGGGTVWPVATISSPQWSGISSDVVFGIRSGRLVVLDALQRAEQLLDPITSLVSAGGTLWTTAGTPLGQTVLQGRDASTPNIIRSTTTIDGTWTVHTTYTHQVYLRSSTNDIRLVTSKQPTSITLKTLDAGDMLWQSTSADPLIWQHGSEIRTLNTKNQITFIDRWTTPLVGAWWYKKSDTLLWADTKQVVARSIIPETGDRILARWDVPENAKILLVDQDERIWIQSATSLTSWYIQQP
jgi:hypothetical protein